MATTGNGNVYVTTGAGVYTGPANCTSSGCVTTVGGGFTSPQDVAADGSGNLYIADGAGGVKEMPTVCTSSACVTALGGGFTLPIGVAVDGSGSVYVADESGNTVTEILRQLAGVVPVGSSASPVPISFSFTSGGSGITVSVLTQGATGLDFTDAGTGTCDTNGSTYTYGAGNTCTVNVTFAPKFPGARYGAVNLLNGSTVIATAHIYGTGQGPQLVFPKNTTLQTPGGGFGAVIGVAVDANGNVYGADAANNAVGEVPPGCLTSECVIPLGGGFDYPEGVAVDGAGNIYVADQHSSAVKEMPPGCASSDCVITLGGGFSRPTGVAVDGNGNVYVADYGNNLVYQMTPGCSSSGCVTTLGGDLSQPTSVAVDGLGNLFVTDTGHGQLKKMPPGCYSSTLCPWIAIAGLPYGGTGPIGVAVDGSGNIYYVGGPVPGAYEVPPGCISVACVTYMPGIAAGGVAVDGAGNLYFATGGTAIPELNLTTPNSLSFEATNLGLESADSPRTVTLQNLGNVPLTFPVPATGQVSQRLRKLHRRFIHHLPRGHSVLFGRHAGHWSQLQSRHRLHPPNQRADHRLCGSHR